MLHFRSVVGLPCLLRGNLSEFEAVLKSHYGYFHVTFSEFWNPLQLPTPSSNHHFRRFTKTILHINAQSCSKCPIAVGTGGTLPGCRSNGRVVMTHCLWGRRDRAYLSIRNPTWHLQSSWSCKDAIPSAVSFVREKLSEQLRPAASVVSVGGSSPDTGNTLMVPYYTPLSRSHHSSRKQHRMLGMTPSPRGCQLVIDPP